ncbi:MAG: single-stranded DNA-binding protein [Chloroflexota bacterium]|nr:single-stranded DNA-binding protein [Chloroflexota bacterium]
MHKIVIIGNLGRDPEMRYTPSGQGVTSFSVASNRRYRTADGEQREETMWFNVNAWGRQAEICNQYLTRGSQVYVEGTLTTRIFTGNDGQPRVSNDVRMTEMQMIGSRGGGMEDDRAPYGGDMGRGGMDDYNSPGGYSGGGMAGERSMGGGFGNQSDDIDDLPF